MSHSGLDATTHAAIDWAVRLDAGNARAGERHAFNAWFNSDPAHRDAWHRISGLLQQPLAALRCVDGRTPGQLYAASQVLNAPKPAQRRTLLGAGLILLLIVLGASALWERVTPLDGLLGDRQTDTGERRTFALGDGSRLTLNARSSVDLQSDAAANQVHLRAGELLASAAPGSEAPLTVTTRQGAVRATDARFLVRQEEGRSLVAVQENSVQLLAGGQSYRLQAGQAAWLGSEDIHPAAASPHTRGAWQDGQLDMRNEPLGELVEALRPYRQEMLRVSPAAARLRVQGVFSLDDSAQTLRTLAATLPIQVSHYGPWVTLIELR